MDTKDFIKREKIGLESFPLPSEVRDDGRHLWHRFEVEVTRDGKSERFEYGMGDGHRVELNRKPSPRRGSDWVRYLGPLPVRFESNGTPKAWPKGTKNSDADRYARTRCATPELADVLHCLAMDSSGASWDYGQADFGEWAREYGYTDPGTAWETWQAVQANAAKLRKLFGHVWDEFLTLEEAAE